VKTLICLLSFIAFVAAAEVRSIKLATGELLVHPFNGGVPLPAESEWSLCQGAGPALVPEDGRYRLNWNVILKAKGASGRLRDVVRATMQEVAGPSAVLFFDGQPKPTDDGLIILAPAQTVSREHYPWLYSSEPTLFVLRVLLFKAGQQDKLLQPVVIGTEIKQKLKDGGYLP
jgi:hypothetical protein